MPIVAYCILKALVELGGSGDVYQIAAASGYEINTVYAFYVRGGRQAGWIEKPRWSVFMLTERGKIAYAIETGRRTKAAAVGQWYCAQQFGEFVRNNA